MFTTIVRAQYGLNGANKITSNQQKQMVDYFNSARAQVGTAPLLWDSKMENAAVQCLQKKSRGQMQHGICGDSIGQASGFGSAGENIQSGGDGPNAALSFIGEMCSVGNWNEYTRPGNYHFSGSDGHYSQVVWKTSKKVSCAQVINNGVIYCHFAPAGNMIGFSDSVVGKSPNAQQMCPNGRFDTNAFKSKIISSAAPVVNKATQAAAPTVKKVTQVADQYKNSTPKITAPVITPPKTKSTEGYSTSDSKQLKLSLLTALWMLFL